MLGDDVLAFHERGRSLQIITCSDPGFDSYFSGNTTDICPVGALTTADFRFGDYDFTLFVVHLKAGREENDRFLRDAQSLLMAQWLEDRPASADEDVIFLGDFNDDYDADSLEPIAREIDFLTDELGFAASYIGGDFFSWIDHIAVTTGSGAQDEFCSIAVFDLDAIDMDENLYEAWVSDHLPVVAEFTTGE
ncbi:MAG: hypothetical protein HC927_10700 [Deltaproteobacteria bacterium]|nr:hypothetical protein [Deltaproteobacteria bacterium]